MHLRSYSLVLHWLLASLWLHVAHAVVGHHHKRVHIVPEPTALNDIVNPTFRSIEEYKKFLPGTRDNRFPAHFAGSGRIVEDPSRRCSQRIAALHSRPGCPTPRRKSPPPNWSKKEIVKKGCYSNAVQESEVKEVEKEKEKPKTHRVTDEDCCQKKKKVKPRKGCYSKAVKEVEQKEKQKKVCCKPMRCKERTETKKKKKCPCRKKMPFPKVHKACTDQSKSSRPGQLSYKSDSPVAAKSCHQDPCACGATPPPLPFRPPSCPKPPPVQKRPGSHSPSNSKSGTAGKSPLFYSVDSPACTCMFGSINIPPGSGSSRCGSSSSVSSSSCCCGPPCRDKIDDTRLKELMAKHSDTGESMTILEMPKPKPCCPCPKPKSRSQPWAPNPDPCDAGECDKEVNRIIEKYENVARKRDEIYWTYQQVKEARRKSNTGTVLGEQQVASDGVQVGLISVAMGEPHSDVEDLLTRLREQNSGLTHVPMDKPHSDVSSGNAGDAQKQHARKRCAKSRIPRLVYSVSPGVFGMVSVKPSKYDIVMPRRPEELKQPQLTRNAAGRGMPYRRTTQLRKVDADNERKNEEEDGAPVRRRNA